MNALRYTFNEDFNKEYNKLYDEMLYTWEQIQRILAQEDIFYSDNEEALKQVQANKISFDDYLKITEANEAVIADLHQQVINLQNNLELIEEKALKINNLGFGATLH